MSAAPQPESVLPCGWERDLARRRYQRGGLRLVRGYWVGRWREDFARPDGTVVRRHRQERLGTRTELPTKRLAQRALDAKLAEVNAPGYRPRLTLPFAAAAMRWKRDVLSQQKPSTQHSAWVQVQKHVLPALGGKLFYDLTPEAVQAWASALDAGPKTRCNIVGYARSIWKAAQAWGWVKEDFPAVALPKLALQRGRTFTAEQVRRIVAEAPEPWATLYTLIAETGLRAGEVAALRVEDIGEGVLTVRGSAWEGRQGTPKTDRGLRALALTPELAARLRALRSGETAGLLFRTRAGTPIRGRKVVEERLGPLLARLGIPHAGLHALRHANATEMLRAGVPLRTVTARLGHADPQTTLRLYVHAVGADDAEAARRVSAILRPVVRGT